ncbi:AMP-binding protein [Pontibacter pamirensis]|uniref:AMP-binding protein n=1 Tax=Pontibacter pamirensis TaxID=2562824 RepID=UPI0013894656|nr:AMP-binding protein [Pontibacter pamirensis]
MTHNFFENMYASRHTYQDRELIVWPTGGKDLASVSYTGKDINLKIAAIRQALEALPVQNGQKVLLAMPVGFNLICSLLAVMATGAAPVLPPAKFSKAALLKLLHRSNIKVVLLADKPSFLFRLLGKVLDIKLLFIHKQSADKAALWLPPEPVSPNQPALVSHSSGSTGKSKQIYRSHRVLQAQHTVLKAIFPPLPAQRDFPLFPNILLHNLSLGITSVLPDLPWADLTQLKPARIVAQIKQQQIDTLTGNLYYFRKLYAYLQQHPDVMSQVQAIGMGGSPITERLAHDLKEFFPKATVYIIYGSSEAEPIAVRKVGSQKEAPHKGYAVGAVYPSLTYKIEAIGDVVLPDGTAHSVGEIKVQGAHVATSGTEGWLSTGDFGYVDEKNVLFLTGRKGNEQLHSGVQHYQVEHVLRHQPGIARAAAQATAEGFDVYIEGPAKEIEIRQALQQYFPAQIVHRVLFREQLPVDARHHSKILYSNLK